MSSLLNNLVIKLHEMSAIVRGAAIAEMLITLLTVSGLSWFFKGSHMYPTAVNFLGYPALGTFNLFFSTVRVHFLISTMTSIFYLFWLIFVYNRAGKVLSAFRNLNIHSVCIIQL